MLRAKLVFLLLLLFPLLAFSRPTDSTFILETNSLEPYFPGYIGNGYFSLVSTQLGITDAPSYMARVFDHGPDDVPRIAILPAWNGIDLHNGQNWLSKITASSTNISPYHQRIDMYRGVLQTHYQWRDGEKITEVDAESFVSRSNPNLAAMKLTVTPHYNGPVRISFTLRDWPSPKRMPLEKLEKYQPGPKEKWPRVWYPGNMLVKEQDSKFTEIDGKAWMISTAEGRQTTIAQVMEVKWPSGLKVSFAKTEKVEGLSSVDFEFQSENKPYTFYKFVAIESSYVTKDPAKTANDVIGSVKSKSYDSLLAENATAWRDLWETDVVIEGDPELQKMVHSMIFYLLCSLGKDTDFAIPPMGLASDGYYGHMFWDGDTWMFPPLLVMHPDLAKSMVMFRYRTLDAARKRAKNMGFRGAMYPWEADELGNETTPFFAIQNANSEIHVTGDVALAQWEYYLATGDKNYLKEFGYPVLRETADFWVSRVTYNKEKDRYEIHNVVSVDEGLIGIKNDTYTNAVAKKNLELAITASLVLGNSLNPEWKKVADGMFIPYKEAASYHPTYENAPEESRGSVVPLLSFPLQIPMSEQAKRNNLLHAAKRLEKEGSGAMMGVTLLTVVAAELGDKELFEKLYPISYKGYLRPPFNALAETPRNDGTNFITGAGGFLQQLIYGFTGLRLNEDGLTKKFSPMLPASIKKIHLKNFTVRNKKFDMEFSKQDAKN
jgi:trehalose/maltose hydrolase-like predicted phosphorylase